MEQASFDAVGLFDVSNSIAYSVNQGQSVFSFFTIVEYFSLPCGIIAERK